MRLGGLPDNPRTDPQDRAWFGPHDRLVTEEESEQLDFENGPEYGTLPPFLLPCFVLTLDFVVWCWGWDGAGDLDGPDVDPIWERMPNKSIVPNAVKVRHRRDLNL